MKQLNWHLLTRYSCKNSLTYNTKQKKKMFIKLMQQGTSYNKYYFYMPKIAIFTQ